MGVVCKYCKKEFKRESTLASHMCEKKRRWHQREERYVQIGFHAWLKFMENVQNNRKKPYEYQDFVDSKLYLDFTKYGRYVMALDIVNPNDYTKFLIKNGIALKDWTKDYPYETYIRELISKESPEKALERSLKVLEEWSTDHEEDMSNFFKKINTYQAVQWIMSGKISPWLIFCSSTSHELLERLNDEQTDLIHEIINVSRWKVKIKHYQKEFDNAQKVLEEVGL